MNMIQNHITKLGGRLAMILLLLATASAWAQNSEAAPEVRILTYTNSAYSDEPYYSDWAYPDGNVRNSGYARTRTLTAFSRYDGCLLTNYSASTSDLTGWSEGDWFYYSESRNSTSWSGPCPAIATSWNYWTNLYVWGGTGNLWNWWDQSSSTDTNYYWEPYEARQALTVSFQPGWTLEYDSGLPHLGCFYKRTNYYYVDTTLELSLGGEAGSTNDVTMKLNVWAFDNLRGRWLTWNEIWVNGKHPDTNDCFYFLGQDNLRTNLVFEFGPTNGLPGTAPPGAVQDFTFWAYGERHHVLVGVDKDLDGSIDLDGTNDLTSTTAPYVFWANDDFDEYHRTTLTEWLTIGDYWEYDDMESGMNTDFMWPLVKNERDLEDFTLIAVRLPPFVTTNGDWTVNLIAAGAMKILSSPASDFSYLSSQTVAEQIVTNASLRVTNLSTLLTSQASAYFLADFGFAFDGPVGFELLYQGTLVGRGLVHVSIKDITSMYDRFTAGDQDGATVSADFQPLQTAQVIAQADAGTLQFYGDTNYVLLVHGWNMRIWEKERFAESMFKRLWWQGYRGRCGLFRWQTYTLDHWAGISLANYDCSEFNSWKSALALNRLLASLNSSYPTNVRVLAHSMGNVVTGEALRMFGTNPTVHTYLAMQGALPAHCYDPVALHNDPDSGTYTPDRYSQYWTNGASQYIQTKAALRYINMPNPLDYALKNWRRDQKMKPDDSLYYGYLSDYAPYHSGFYRAENFTTYHMDFPLFTYNNFAFGVQPRCVAIGAAPSLSGVFDSASEINLETDFSFQRTHDFHSKQFRSTIVQQWALYRRMMETLGFPVR